MENQTHRKWKNIGALMYALGIILMFTAGGLMLAKGVVNGINILHAFIGLIGIFSLISGLYFMSSPKDAEESWKRLMGQKS